MSMGKKPPASLLFHTPPLQGVGACDQMAFKFTWPEFSKDLYDKITDGLETALNNRSGKPSSICDLIKVKQVHLGSKPPQLDILEIGEMSRDRFRGIFKFAYNGDAVLVLETKVQANPLTPASSCLKRSPLYKHLYASPSATAPLIVPMELTISNLRLRGIFVLILSRTRGLTLSFKNDPLESIQVGSTFDGVVESVKGFLQKEIEERMRIIFREELPAILYRLSLEWLRDGGCEHLGANEFALDEECFTRQKCSTTCLPRDEHLSKWVESQQRPFYSLTNSLLPTRSDSPTLTNHKERYPEYPKTIHNISSSSNNHHFTNNIHHTNDNSSTNNLSSLDIFKTSYSEHVSNAAIHNIYFLKDSNIIHRTPSHLTLTNRIAKSRSELEQWKARASSASIRESIEGFCRSVPLLSDLLPDNLSEQSNIRDDSVEGLGSSALHVQNESLLPSKQQSFSWAPEKDPDGDDDNYDTSDHNNRKAVFDNIYDPDEFRSQTHSIWAAENSLYRLETTSAFSYPSVSHQSMSQGMKSHAFVKQSGSLPPTASLQNRLAILHTINASSSPFLLPTLQSNAHVVGRHSRRASFATTTNVTRSNTSAPANPITGAIAGSTTGAAATSSATTTIITIPTTTNATINSSSLSNVLETTFNDD